LKKKKTWPKKAYARASESVAKAEGEVQEWNKLIRANLNNPAFYVSERDKANERLDKARADLDKREAFVLQLTQPAKRSKSALDITRKYYQELVRDINIRSFDTFPKLKTFLSSPLPVKYPTMEENLSETFSEVFEYSTDKIVVPNVF
jgi:hypothetical protein